MSIELERGNRIGGAGFTRGISCFPIYDSPVVAGIPPERLRFGWLAPAAATAEGTAEQQESASCSSSIGRNSDSSAAGASEGEDSGEAEVQSTYKGPLDTMDALEDSLPIRRGISEFYRGKSKSFTSLSDVVSSSPSAKELAKPENPCTRKRKNPLAFSTMFDRPRLHNISVRSTEGGICKRPAFSSRSTLALTANTTSSSESNSNSSEEEEQPLRLLPPLYPHSKPAAAAAAVRFGSSPHKKLHFPARSFSLTDLQGVAGSIPSVGSMDKHRRFK